MSAIEEKLEAMGMPLPRPPAAIGAFAPGVVHGGVLYVSGTYGTVKDEAGTDVIPKPGKVGAELTIEDGYESARLMALNHLALAKEVVGDLDALLRPIRLVGYVNAAPGFRNAPAVLNGASDLLLQLFGDDLGRHARMALYQHELARDAPVAGEIMFALRT
ncbi:MAG: RidA family protein [Parvibaculaceae bacterium]